MDRLNLSQYHATLQKTENVKRDRQEAYGGFVVTYQDFSKEALEAEAGRLTSIGIKIGRTLMNVENIPQGYISGPSDRNRTLELDIGTYRLYSQRHEPYPKYEIAPVLKSGAVKGGPSVDRIWASVDSLFLPDDLFAVARLAEGVQSLASIYGDTGLPELGVGEIEAAQEPSFTR